MPIVRNNHLARAPFEQKMADLSVSNMARIIHTELADLHLAAGHARIGRLLADGESA